MLESYSTFLSIHRPPPVQFPLAAVQLEPAAGAIYPEQQHCYIAMVMDPRMGLWEGLDFRVTADEVSGERYHANKYSHMLNIVRMSLWS